MKSMLLFVSAGIASLLFASCPGNPLPPGPPGYDCANPPAFVRGQVVRVEHPIEGQYIVVRKAGVGPAAVQPLMHVTGVSVTQTLDQGYVARIAQSALRTILSDPNVAYVQQDGIKSVPPDERRTAMATESWGLDRVDQRVGTDGQYDPGATGAGVNVAVIDTGVSDHPDFEGRLNTTDCFSAHGACSDGHGHGTHVAGTVGGKTWGVAKKATLWIARVLNASGSGSDSQVIAGINWVAAKKRANPEQQWAANMSLGGSPSPALDQAVCDALGAGVAFAIAAGNENRDADTSSPARVRQAVTVGAIQRFGDQRASFSNFGPLLDVFAPGVDIESTQPGGGTATFSGTSMASPHVAGAIALYLERHPGAPPSQVEAGIFTAATPDRVANPGVGSPNLLLYVKED